MSTGLRTHPVTVGVVIATLLGIACAVAGAGDESTTPHTDDVVAPLEVASVDRSEISKRGRVRYVLRNPTGVALRSTYDVTILWTSHDEAPGETFSLASSWTQGEFPKDADSIEIKAECPDFEFALRAFGAPTDCRLRLLDRGAPATSVRLLGTDYDIVFVGETDAFSGAAPTTMEHEGETITLDPLAPRRGAAEPPAHSGASLTRDEFAKRFPDAERVSWSPHRVAPDGKTIWSVSSGGPAAVRDAESGKPLDSAWKRDGMRGNAGSLGVTFGNSGRIAVVATPYQSVLSFIQSDRRVVLQRAFVGEAVSGAFLVPPREQGGRGLIVAVRTRLPYE